MFFILSKILALFIQPITWVVACLSGALLSKSPIRKKRLSITGLVLLLFFSNQYLSSLVMIWWELPPVPMAGLDFYDVGIVFTGVTKGSKKPADRIYFNHGADRITHTLQLYNEGKLGHILISGGLGFQQSSKSRAAERLKSFLLMSGLPDSVITVEPEAVNTYENAVKSSEILKRDFPGQKYLLITSAFHIKRAALCMEAQGLDFDQFPAGYFTGSAKANFNKLFIPKSDAIMRWEKLIKEWVGILMYKVMGYLP